MPTLLPALGSHLNTRGGRAIWYFSEVALAPGDKFGRYTIVGTLGIGGMGQVLRAIDNVLERPVALKIIRADKGEQAEAVSRFFREARLAAQLTHANTVQVYDLGTLDDIPFIAMEYIDGKPLSQLCGGDVYDPVRKMRWMLSAARGLAAAHKRGMVHRDVKPANIMAVPDEDIVKVVDFGLAKRTKTTPQLAATFQTALGFVVGTPQFMAPEQLDGAEPDGRADQFSWGLTAYTLLTGANPRLHNPLLLDPIEPIGAHLPRLSPDVGDVIMTALARNPAKRHPTMDRVVDELDTALNKPIGRVVVMTGDMPARDARDIRDREVAKPKIETMPLEAAPVPHFVRRVKPCPAAPLHVASFSPDGKRIIAFGVGGVMICENDVWSPYATPPWLDPQDVACAALLGDGSAIIGGKIALAARILPGGNIEQWHPPAPRHDVRLRGVEVTANRTITFVGSVIGGQGVLGWATPAGLRLVAAPSALSAVATLSGDRGQIACGPRGALVRSFQGTLTHRSLGHADLLAVTAAGHDAFVVGSRGYVYRVTSSLDATLEPVQTTGTLTAVSRERDGTPWAASAQGRILRRDETGHWSRRSGDFGVEPNVLALFALDEVRAVDTDGAIISIARGRIARSPA